MQTSVTCDWNDGNLVANGDFTKGVVNGLPAGWEPSCPNPALAPKFELVTPKSGKPMLMATGNGRKECWGVIKHPITFEAGKTYRFRVHFKFEGFEDVNHHMIHAVFGPEFNQGVMNYKKDGDWVIGDTRFEGPEKEGEGFMHLYFRYSPNGKVWWDHVSISECEPIPSRPVKIAVNWGYGDMEHWDKWLDLAGQKFVDIALLPESFNGKGVKDPESIDGEANQFMAKKARRWRIHVAGSVYEKRGDLTLNTGSLYGPDGKLIGTYSKNQLFDPECDEGATSGTEMPVFQTRFGKVAFVICYDSWFPEPMRLAAYKGAELILFPSAGYFLDLMPARAADNGVWIAASSGCPAGVWDPSGARAGEEYASETRYCKTGILNYEMDAVNRMIVVTIDMSKKYSPHYWGGPIHSAPGGRRIRQTRIVSLEDQIAQEVKRWWDE
ncbi:MAG: carbon-nitrogen hydrolase family protein [bacterium]